MRVVVRIRTNPGRKICRSRRPNRRHAWLAASLCWPLALFCYFVCAWRWSFDLAWTGRFLVTDGILFHWQVWCVVGAALHFLAVWLTRYAGPIETAGVARSKPHVPITVREVEHAGQA